MADARVPQGRVRSVTEGADAKASQGRVRAVFNYPSEAAHASQLTLRSFDEPSPRARSSQGVVRTLIKRWEGDPKVRAWGYSQDGHDFYVLHLGDQGTVVYDSTTGAWSQWRSNERDNWRAAYGTDWIGIGKANYLGGAASQIIAGDEEVGILWSLDPTKGVDDSAKEAGEVVPIYRAVRGGIGTTERNNARNNGIWLRISTGEPVPLNTEIQLRSSDDQGKTWFDHGTVTVNAGEWDQDITWRSLGLIRPPGRIFEFLDQGAMVRIDGADIDFGDGDKSKGD